MSELSELTELFSGITPKDWTVSGSQVNEGLPGYRFEWTQDNERVGSLTLEVFPEGVFFIGFEAQEGKGLFRGLCRVFPRWAKDRGITRLVVPLAQSEQMRTLLADAGFRNTALAVWEADLADPETAESIRGYGKG